MQRSLVVLSGWIVIVLSGVTSANVLNMGPGLTSLETVPVGNINNATDSTGYGSVGYTYNIGKYEVTAGQYTEFLNKVAGMDANGLYNTDMWSSDYGCKIERYAGNGTTVPYQYRVASDYANRPVNYVSFWDSCRFANWLHNGQPSGVQDNSTTENGAYTLTAQGISYNTVSRNGNWQWAVTSEDEWYKAAYYKGGTTNTGYWRYPTGSNTAPGRDMNDASGNNANYRGNPYPIDSAKYTTLVGEFQNSDSPYGTFDQGGNVWEWTEAVPYSSYRGLRGGAFYIDDGMDLDSSFYYGYDATIEDGSIGLRVSQVPEPVTLSLLALGGLLVARRRWV